MPFSCKAIFLGMSIRLRQREPGLPLKRLLPPSQVPCAHSPLLLGELEGIIIALCRSVPLIYPTLFWELLHAASRGRETGHCVALHSTI